MSSACCSRRTPPSCRTRAPVEWAPVAPYWSVLWRSGVALARELDGVALRGLRVVELGCGLAVPSIAAARAGATVLATDACAEALTLVARNAHANDVRIETATVDSAEPDELVRRAPFDLVLAADVLYERASVAPLLSLLPRLAPEAWLADPGRPAAGAFIEQAGRRWPVETRVRDVVRILPCMGSACARRDRSNAEWPPEQVSLRSPVPLDTPLDVVRENDGSVRVLDVEAVVAEARPAPELDVEVPAPVSSDDARVGDGALQGIVRWRLQSMLRLQAGARGCVRSVRGAVEGRQLVASPWTPPP